jgi:hypothetical protein
MVLYVKKLVIKCPYMPLEVCESLWGVVTFTNLSWLGNLITNSQTCRGVNYKYFLFPRNVTFIELSRPYLCYQWFMLLIINVLIKA